MSEPAPGVALADTVGPGRYDLATLAKGLEDRGAVVTVVRKDSGPIAAQYGGVQYSLAVATSHQSELDLRTLVPEGAETGLAAGLLANTAYLLHCSEAVWQGTVLPALAVRMRVRAAFAASDAGYLARTLAQRQPGAGGAGSRFLREMTLAEVRGAAWAPYSHPAVAAPAVAFRAPLPGTFGLVRLDSLEPEAEVVLRDPAGHGEVEACVPGAQGQKVDFTVLLVGPAEGGGEEVWTFFLGEPISPSRIPTEGNAGWQLTAAEAIGLGLVWAKVE